MRRVWVRARVCSWVSVCRAASLTLVMVRLCVFDDLSSEWSVVLWRVWVREWVGSWVSVCRVASLTLVMVRLCIFDGLSFEKTPRKVNVEPTFKTCLFSGQLSWPLKSQVTSRPGVLQPRNIASCLFSPDHWKARTRYRVLAFDCTTVLL